MKIGDDHNQPDSGSGASVELLSEPDAPNVPLPALLPSQATLETQRQAEGFFRSVQILEAWVGRHASPEDGLRLFHAGVPDVQRWRDHMAAAGRAPKPIGRRLASLSGFHNYLAGVASEMRLPMNLPNPASSQFVARPARDPVSPTLDFSPNMAHQLLALPSGETSVDYRDRAIQAVDLYTGVRRSTACRLVVRDFLDDDPGRARLNIKEKGGRSRVIGLHPRATEAIRQYVHRVGTTSPDAPLFRIQENPRSKELGDRALSRRTMHDIVKRRLRELTDTPEGEPGRYSAHSLRATTATQLPTAGVDIAKVESLLGHKHVTTTQIYDKRRYSTGKSASHGVPI